MYPQFPLTGVRLNIRLCPQWPPWLLKKYYNSKQSTNLSTGWETFTTFVYHDPRSRQKFFFATSQRHVFYTFSESSVFLRTVVHFWSQSNVDGFYSIYTIFQLMASRQRGVSWTRFECTIIHSKCANKSLVKTETSYLSTHFSSPIRRGGR